MRGGLYGLAARHLTWVLSGREPEDATDAEKSIYAGVTIEDRTTAAKLVVEYTLPKPKTQVGLKHEGKGDTVVVEVRTLAAEEKA